jgi:hypothetical protein
VDGESHKIFFRRNKEEAMIWKKFIPLIAAVSILGLSACGGKSPATPSEGAIQTAIAQTDTEEKKMEKAVNATLTALGKGGAPAADANTTFTPQAPTISTTSGIITVSVSANTWCMTGPDVIYDKVFILYIGETAEVIGKDAYGVYWVIKNPKNPAVTCWLWAYYATINGDPSKLPVITPPPTPTPLLPTLTPTKTHPPSKVTAVSISVAHSNIDTNDANCHYSQNYAFSISTDGPVTVDYKITMANQDGIWGDTGLKTMVFTQAGTKTTNSNYSWWHCGNWVFTINTINPNSKSAQASFTVVT